MIIGLDTRRQIELLYCAAFRRQEPQIQSVAEIAVNVFVLTVALLFLKASPVLAEGNPSRDELVKKAESVFGEPKNTTRLSKEGRVWIDKQRKLVIVDGFVTLREGQLEMFACPVGTKEHESIVAIFASSQHIHAGLLAIGAKQGKPTQFEPYRPATGSTIKIHVLFLDEKGEKQNKPAQSWIRNVADDKELQYDWVFAGSILYKDPDTGEETYLADSGDLICVANFPTATLDLAIQSISSNSFLTYAAFTERLPPRFTVVRLVLEVSDQTPKQITEKKKSEGK